MVNRVHREAALIWHLTSVTPPTPKLWKLGSPRGSDRRKVPKNAPFLPSFTRPENPLFRGKFSRL